MAVANSKSTSRSRPYYFRICKRIKSLKNFESLPDEVVFNILIQLSVEDISNSAMVCSKWYRMTRTHEFVHAHRVQHSISGIVIRVLTWDRLNRNPPVFMAMRKGRIHVSEFSYPIKVDIWRSCNGLILQHDLVSKPVLQITNPATKQQFTVPPFPRRISHHKRSALSYSAASMEYKVVTTHGFDDENLQLAILTVGVDKSWRHVRTRHLTPSAKIHLCSEPIITDGFVHWAGGPTNTHVLTLNVETEIIAQHPVPQVEAYVRKAKCYFPAGKSISLFVIVSDLELEGWEMKSETGEWTKVYNIDFAPRLCEFERFRSERHPNEPFGLVPAGWIKYQEALVFYFLHTSRFCTAYNLLTKEFDFFELRSDAGYHEYEPHVTNNLEWLTWS